MTGAPPDMADELEELDVVEKIMDIESRLHALSLSLSGAGIANDIFLALSAILDDARDRCDDLEAALRAQDATKRARGEPRAGRAFIGEADEEGGHS
jgi:hypothetical protein